MAIIEGIGVLIMGALGASLGSYFKTKGQNLATHEDLDKLVEQVQAVTQTTESIRASIADIVWDRQKQWELKRDTFFELIRAVGLLDSAIIDLSTANARSQPAPAESATAWNAKREAASQKWKVAVIKATEMKALTELVCGHYLKCAASQCVQLRVTVGNDLLTRKEPIEYLRMRMPTMHATFDVLRAAVRDELNIEPLSETHKAILTPEGS